MEGIHIYCNDTKKYSDQQLHFIRPFKETKIFWAKKLLKELRWLWKKHETQKLFSLIAINLVGTIVLLIWCQLTCSLALLAYTYLSWFNFLSLLTWLLCIWVETQTASYSFTFGLARCEVLAVFTSVTLTLMGSLFIIKESIERMIQPEVIHVEHLSCMALIGFILNVVMTTLIQNPPLTHVLKCSPSSVLQDHFADMCHSLCFQLPYLKRFLPSRFNPLILISLVGLFLIVGNHIIIEIYNYSRCDTIAAFLIAGFTISTMYPLSICSAELLLQTIPLQYCAHLDRCLTEALTLDGVLEFCNEKFWVLGVGCKILGREVSSSYSVPGEWSGFIVAGSLHVRVRRDANEQVVLRHVIERLKPLVPVLTVQVFKDDWRRSHTLLPFLGNHASVNTSDIFKEPSPPSSRSAIVNMLQENKDILNHALPAYPSFQTKDDREVTVNIDG